MLFVEGEVLCFFSVLYLEYIGCVVKFFSDIGGWVLLMYGIEGEVYVNLQCCLQINFIDCEGMWVLYEKQDIVGSELLL